MTDNYCEWAIENELPYEWDIRLGYHEDMPTVSNPVTFDSYDELMEFKSAYNEGVLWANSGVHYLESEIFSTSSGDRYIGFWDLSHDYYSRDVIDKTNCVGMFTSDKDTEPHFIVPLYTERDLHEYEATRIVCVEFSIPEEDMYKLFEPNNMCKDHKINTYLSNDNKRVCPECNLENQS